MAALHNGNADGKHCSKACVPELRFITAEVAVPDGTALIAALCSLHISMTLYDITPQCKRCGQMHIVFFYRVHICAALHNGNADGKSCSNACVTEFRFITAEVAVLNGTALIAAGCSLHISMTLQHSASQWNASDQMHIFLIYKEHLLAALHNGNADGKHCSKACVPELRFITAEVALPNGTHCSRMFPS